MPYYIEPDVAGEIGSESILETKAHPPIVHKLHFVFEGWLGDDIIETFPCFLVTEKLRKSLQQLGFSGIEFDDVKISKSATFREIYGDKTLPKFVWAKITGNQSNNDDFFISQDHRLVVSDAAYAAISKFKIENAIIEDFG